MTAIVDMCDKVRLWLNEGAEVYPNDMVTTWVNGANELLNSELRIADMIQIDTATVTDPRVTLPSDWIEADFVRVVGGRPLVFKNRHDFYTPNDQGTYDNRGKYTIVGKYIVLGDAGVSTPLDIEMSYYGDIPVMENDDTWMQTRYPLMYLFATLEVGSLYGLEDDRMGMWKDRRVEMTQKLNDAHMKAKASGSRLSFKSRGGFG